MSSSPHSGSDNVVPTEYGEGMAHTYDEKRFEDAHGRLFHRLELRGLMEALADRPRRIFSYCRNYTFIAHKHLSAWRRVVFRLWWLLMGERSAWAPGAATLAALRGDLSWRKEMAAARAGKREGMRLWREWVRSGGSR